MNNHAIEVAKKASNAFRAEHSFGGPIDAATLMVAIESYEAALWSDDMAGAPYDEFVMVRVESGMIRPKWDYVLCKRHSDGYKHSGWVNAQNDRLTDSHTGEVTHWRPTLGGPSHD